MEHITVRTKELKVQEGKKKERLDVYLTNSIENTTRSRVQKLIKGGCVTVNGSFPKANYIINPGDEILVNIPISPRAPVNLPEDIPLNIVFEDDYLLVINKPAGLVVHPSVGHINGTLVNALLYHIDKLSELGGKGRPGIVHRLDKDTSGLLLIAKDEFVHSHLSKQFANREVDRKYWAIVWGNFQKNEGEIISRLTRSKSDRKIFTTHETEGKLAHTTYKVLEQFEFASLIQLKLMTGRTHQIRVHMNSIKHPIFGDATYSGRQIHYGWDLPKMKSRVNNLLEIVQRQALHAKTLGFTHPVTKEWLEFDSSIPNDMVQVIANLRSTMTL